MFYFLTTASTACVYYSRSKRALDAAKKKHAGVRTMNDERRERTREKHSRKHSTERVYCHANSARTESSIIAALPSLSLSSVSLRLFSSPSLSLSLLFVLSNIFHPRSFVRTFCRRCFLNNVTWHMRDPPTHRHAHTTEQLLSTT